MGAWHREEVSGRESSGGREFGRYGGERTLQRVMEEIKFLLFPDA